MSDDVTALYLDAARTFTGLVQRIGPRQWDRYGLGDWDVLALTGHTSRSLVTVLTYLDQPARTETVTTPEGYLAALGTMQIDAKAVADRGRQAGDALEDDRARAVGKLFNDVTKRLQGQDLDAVITTIVGGMRVRNYLPTRTFELVVHSLDLARATGVTVEFDPEVLIEATQLAARTAVLQGQAQQMLFAVTGRPEPGFSIV